MTLPDIKVEMAFGKGPSSQVNEDDWTDVSSRLRRSNTADIRRGRNHELDRVEVGRASITLSNADGAFDPTNEGSPYWPNVVPLTPVRITAQFFGEDYPLFRGFVDEWPLGYPAKGQDAVSTVELVDILEPLNQVDVYGNYGEKVLDEEPVLYWKLDDEGWQRRVEDHSGNEYHGNYVGPERYREDDLLDGGGGYSYRFLPSAIAALPEAPASVRRVRDMTISLWVDLGSSTNLVDCSDGEDGHIAYRLNYNSHSHKLEWRQARAVAVDEFVVESPELPADVRHIEVTRSRSNRIEWRINGRQIGTSNASTFPSNVGPQQFSVASSEGVRGAHGEVTISHVAIFPDVQPLSKTKKRWRARLDKMPIQSASERLETAFDYLDYPQVELDLDPGISKLPEYSPEGGSFQDFVLDVAASEGGFLFIDGAGKVILHDRHHRIRGDYEPVMEFSGEFTDIDPKLDPHWLINTVTINNVTIDDQAAVDRYGVREKTVDMPQADDRVAESVAHWVLNRSKEPRIRVESISFKPQKNPNDLWPRTLRRELSDRIRVAWEPLGGHTQTLDCHIEAIKHQVSGGVWTVSFELSPADDQEFWKLEHEDRGQIDNPDYVVAP